MSSITTTNSDFSLLSYNSLAPIYVTESRYRLVSKQALLLNGTDRLMQQASVISRIGADLVLLQEAQKDTAEQLSGWLHDSYELAGTSWKAKTRASIDNGLAVYVRKDRKSLIDNVLTAQLDQEKGTGAQFIHLSDTNLWIANVHFDWERRAIQAAAIHEVFMLVAPQGAELAMIVGDYNGAISEFSTVMGNFEPSLSPVEQNETIATYFSGGHVSKEVASIDHAFASSRIQASIKPVANAPQPDNIEKCLSEYGSDHVPILFSCKMVL